jgi:MFS family permease
MAVYNANGREIGGSDSQPTKLAARALALRGNLRLDDDVAKVPLLGERHSFARDLGGRYRSAYSPVGSIFGGVTAIVLRLLGADLNAPRGPNLIAVLTASALTSAAVCLVFLTLVRFASRGASIAVAVGLGLGTNFWALHSQTLAQHDVVAFGMALALYNWTRPAADITTRRAWAGAVGLGLAVMARTQLAPLVGIVGLGLLARLGWRRAALPLGFAVLMLAALMVAQWRWFGHPLGALPVLEGLHPEVHAVSDSLNRQPWMGAAGLLISPSRGLLIFSPVVLVALLGVRPALRSLRELGVGWGLLASLVMYLGYCLYSVWWGGHSYGPRYLLDVIVLLTPPAAVALDQLVRAPWARALCVMALVWSMIAAGTGAFFAADSWNTSPNEIDRNHGRLWDWRDPQIIRGWKNGLNPQNFNLFNWTSVRQSGPPVDVP